MGSGNESEVALIDASGGVLENFPSNRIVPFTLKAELRQIQFKDHCLILSSLCKDCIFKLLLMIAILLFLRQLYGDFADAFALAECKLAIVHCAGHYDPTLIETLWRDIIDKGKLSQL